MKRILIASHEAAYHLEALVKQLGYTATLVSSGSAALQYLRNDTPDLILADARLPEISGGSLAVRRKKVARLSHIPVCLLVDTYDSKARAEALVCPIDSIVLKPYSASFIKDTVRQHLNRTSFVPSSQVAPAVHAAF
ncbi:MAG: response regulator [Trueperaceae bacterium]|nr:response regulator [Trueperaceae bacterium]